MRFIRATRPGLPAVACLALALLVAACGGSSDPGSSQVASLGDGSGQTAAATTTPAASSSSDPQQAFLDYAACMRKHGVDMPDPTFDSEGHVQIRVGKGGSVGLDDPAFKAAENACRPLLARATPKLSPADREAFQQAALDYARCMREHGVDMPDPDSSKGGIILRAKRGDRDDPAFRAADEQCRSILGDNAPPLVGQGPRTGNGTSS